jgi:protein TonB
MAKPLRSEQVTRPKDVQFKHFGVLDSGAQSKASVFTSVTLNAMILLIAILIGAATKATIQKKQEVTLVVPITEKKPEPPQPVVKPPKPLPPTPKIKPEPPKIKIPEVKLPEPPKVPQVKMAEAKPIVMPAPPKQVVAAAAPKPTNVSLARSASVVNNDAHPTAVRLGSTTAAPIQARPSTSAISLYTATTHDATSAKPTTVALGMPGMAGGNSGNGPRATAVNMGNGQPNGSISGTGKRAVEGVKLGGVTNGVPGAKGGNGTGTQAVALGRVAPPPMPAPAAPTKATARSGPEVVYKPRPVYTAEATAMQLEGTVSVHIRVTATGAVEILGITSGLGHGLDESARQAVAATRFRPAHDGSGNPIDWEGVVKVTFQLAT